MRERVKRWRTITTLVSHQASFFLDYVGLGNPRSGQALGENHKRGPRITTVAKPLCPSIMRQSTRVQRFPDMDRGLMYTCWLSHDERA